MSTPKDERAPVPVTANDIIQACVAVAANEAGEWKNAYAENAALDIADKLRALKGRYTLAATPREAAPLEDAEECATCGDAPGHCDSADGPCECGCPGCPVDAAQRVVRL